MSSSRRALGTASASSVARSAGSYTLPKPSWSLADLKLARRGADDGSAARTTTLSREEVKKLCVLAHIDLGPEGDPGSGLDVAAVQRDVGAMLTCMQTMRRSEDGAYSAEEEHDRNLGEEGEDEDEVEGPWGGAVKWATPLHKDVVSDGDMQSKVLGAAQRSNDGFFTAPRVVGGEDGVP